MKKELKNENENKNKDGDVHVKRTGLMIAQEKFVRKVRQIWSEDRK